MTLFRIILALVLVMVVALLAAGCAGQQKPAIPDVVIIDRQDNGPPESPPPFDSIRMDANIYNVGEVVEFSVVNESPGTGRCADNP